MFYVCGPNPSTWWGIYHHELGFSCRMLLSDRLVGMLRLSPVHPSHEEAGRKERACKALPARMPNHTGLHVLCLEAQGQTILVNVVTRATEARCLLCEYPSERGHSRSRRWVVDLPWPSRCACTCAGFFNNPASSRKI